MSTRVMIYVRQSLGNPEGVARGLKRCREEVVRRGWETVAEFSDNAVSASKVRGDETGWGRMLAAVRRGDAEVIVGVDVDRLVRSIRDLVTLIDLGVKVVTVDGEVDLTTADGEFRATMLAGIARFEVRRKSERQRRANEHRVANGRPVPGRRRFGFEVDGLTLRESEAAQVRSLFERFRDGASIRSLSAEMGWRAVRTRDTLTNPAYVGRLRHHGQEYEAPGIVPTIDRELFDEVGAMLADPSRRTSPGSAFRFLLSGIASCGTCGRSLIRMNNYRCPVDGSHPTIRSEPLDALVMREVATALAVAPLTAFDSPSNVDALAKALRAARRRMEDLRLLVDEGGYPAASAAPQMRALRVECDGIEADIAEARAKTATARLLAEMRGNLWADRVASPDDLIEARRAISEGIEALPLDERRELIRGLVEVVVLPGRSATRGQIKMADRIVIRHRVAVTLNAA